MIKAFQFKWVFGLILVNFLSQICAMEQAEADIARKKDFYLVKNEIVSAFGKDFRHPHQFINDNKVSRDVYMDESLGIIPTRPSPYKNPTADKMFYDKSDLMKYLRLKHEEAQIWANYTKKLIDNTDMSKYRTYPTYSSTLLSDRFGEFLETKKKEITEWNALIKLAQKDSSSLILAPKRHPHDITGITQLHAMGINGEGVEACVWDCGFFKNKHLNYVRDIPTLPGNYEPGDDRGNAEHGTHVSGIISANESAGKNKGVATGATIYPIVYQGLENFVKEIQGTDARVINGSFSFLLDKDSAGGLGLLADELKKNDRLLVMASGNSSKFLDNPYEPNFLKYWFNGMWVGPNYPMILAKNPELAKRLVLVGSLKEDGTTVSRFSNLPGLLPEHFIFAPGENVNSTISHDKFARYSGTSMASPEVTGIFTLLIKYFPKLDMTELKSCVLNATDAFWQDNTNKFSQEYEASVHGRGRINAIKAFQLAQQLTQNKANQSGPSLNTRLQEKARFAQQVGLGHVKGKIWATRDFIVDEHAMDMDDDANSMSIDGDNAMDLS